MQSFLLRSRIWAISIVVFGLMSSSAWGLRVVDEQVILDKLEEYPTCQNHDYSGDWCHDALVRWVEAHPADAFKAGQMTVQAMNAENGVLFFAKAAENKSLNCKDESVKRSVLAGLGMPADKTSAIILAAKKLGVETCGSEMLKAIANETKANDAMMQNVCKELMAKKMLTGVAEKRCARLAQ